MDDCRTEYSRQRGDTTIDEQTLLVGYAAQYIPIFVAAENSLRDNSARFVQLGNEMDAIMAEVNGGGNTQAVAN